MKTIFQTVKNENFVILKNQIFEDGRISLKAKGILGYLLSKPNNWKVYINDIVNHCRDGRDAVMTGINELENAGYIHKERIRNEKTKRYEGILYKVFEDPIDNKNYIENHRLNDSEPKTDFPDTEYPDMEKPDTENPSHSNKDSTNNGSKPKKGYY